MCSPLPEGSLEVLISTPSIARNSMLNLFGLGTPLVVGVLTIPPLVQNLGTERFALLSLAWTLVGYFGFLDLGLGRATTRVVSSSLSGPDERECASLVWAGNRFLLGIGVLGALLVAGSAALFGDRIPIDDAVKPEMLGTFAAIALCMPLVSVTSGLKGILEGLHRFDIVNALRVPLGVANFAAPWMVSVFVPRLDACMLALLLARLLGALAHWLAARRLYPPPVTDDSPRRSLRPLLAEGAWLSFSGVIGPVMVSFDRFLVAGMLGVVSVAFYSAPAEVVSRLGILPTALSAVLFPSFARHSQRDAERTVGLLDRSIKVLFAASFPMYAVLIALAPEGMGWWLGPEFEARATAVLQILALGVFLNGLAFMPSALLQSAGRARLTATLHAIELPIYISVVLGLTHLYGLTGTAVAWTLRAGLDCALMVGASARLMGTPPVGRSLLMGRHGVLIAGLTALATPALAHTSLSLRLGATAVLLILWSVLVGRDLPISSFRRITSSRASTEAVPTQVAHEDAMVDLRK